MSSAALIAPMTLESLGVRRSVLEDLALKIVYLAGELSLQQLAERLKVSTLVAEEIFLRLRKEQLFEVTGMTTGLHRFVTTSAGKNRAQELLRINGYVGPAPISLDDYAKRVEEQSVRSLNISMPQVRAAFNDLVLDEFTIAQLGTAAISGRAVFLYGPSGTGKTSVAQRLARLQAKDPVYIPYAVEVDGQIITIFDPVLHREVPGSEVAGLDKRWVLCERPMVVAGGELNIQSLDLQYHATTRYYAASLQMRANNGLLVIDDFGRQRVQPDELLNRWVVPLDRRVDYLTLAGGTKLEVPFDVLVVFATNLDPAALVDEAFLRRMQTKIKLDSIRRDHFAAIFERICMQEKLNHKPVLADKLADWIENEYHLSLKPCYPRDVVQQVMWRAKLEGKPAELTEETLRDACKNYFV